MNVLVVGSGGREHALVWALKKSSGVDRIFCAPGNGGIQELAECVNLSATDIPGLLRFAKENRIGMTVVGPEMPLWMGIVDAFEDEGLKIFGPRKSAAQIEGSKAFAKEFMRRHGIPTASFQIFESLQNARGYIWSQKPPIVVKADGLAAGKGAVVCRSHQEAQVALEEMMIKRIFGEAGKRVIVEEFMEGVELSLLALTDGRTVVPFVPAQDHKPVYDDDLGPNTGGMGAYAPVPFVDDALIQRIMEEIMIPAIRGLKNEGIEYRGVLYGGLMLTRQGPKVVEFNARFGDPETQAILPLVEGDLLEAIWAVVEGKLQEGMLRFRPGYCTCVIMASGGYPGKYEKGKPIRGLDEYLGDNVLVFHSGTKRENGTYVTSGGRVLGVTALGDSLKASIERAYAAVRRIHFEGAHYRKDIGRKGLHPPQLK
jgi:phosphoribosylamine--glycine ligase